METHIYIIVCAPPNPILSNCREIKKCHQISRQLRDCCNRKTEQQKSELESCTESKVAPTTVIISTVTYQS